MYSDDPNQVHVATLLSVKSEILGLERIEREQRMLDEEIDDDLDDTLEAMKTQKLKGVAKYDDELSEGQGEGSETRIETHELRDSLDSDKTPCATRLDVVNKGEEGDASNFMLWEEKPSGNSVDPNRLPESQMVIVSKVTITEPTRPDQRGSTEVDSMPITPDKTLSLEVHLITDADDPISSPHITTIITTKLTTSKQKKHVPQTVTNAKRFNPMAKQFKALQEKVEEQ
ncbi:hypothetical protein Tco_1038257 [Tanacetum coccineum]